MTSLDLLSTQSAATRPLGDEEAALIEEVAALLVDAAQGR